MCKDGKHHDAGGGSNSFVVGAVFGAVVGAALGMLFAPAEGKETRKKVKETQEKYKIKGAEVYEKASKTASDVRDVAEPLMRQVEEQLTPIIEAANRAGQPLKDQVVERIEQLAFDDPPKSKSKKSSKKRYFKGITK